MNVSLLLVAAVAYLLPEHVSMLGGTQAAWEYVAYGLESAALWLVVGLTVKQLAVRCVALWAMFEAVQRPVCRLVFPMDRPPEIPQGQNLCDAALGLPLSFLSVFAALFAACVIQEVMREGR